MIVPGEVATALVERLRDRLGPSHVLTGESDMESALVELRGLYRGSAIALVRPADVEEVSFVVEQMRPALHPGCCARGQYRTRRWRRPVRWHRLVAQPP